jgi:hypothetical protein
VYQIDTHKGICIIDKNTWSFSLNDNIFVFGFRESINRAHINIIEDNRQYITTYLYN